MGRMSSPQGSVGHSFRSTFTYVTPGSTTTGAMTQGTLRAVPFVVAKTRTFDRIGMEVTTTGEAGSKVRLGIYYDTGTGAPDTLLLDAGTVDGTSVTYNTITISQTLFSGVYWLAAVAQDCATTPPTARVLSGSTQQIGYSGSPSSTTLIAHSCATAFTTGALPATWGAPTSQGNTCRVGLRAD